MKKNKFSLKNYKRINNILIFIIISFLFLATVKITKKYTKDISYKINLYDLPQDKIIVDQSSENINLTVNSYGFNFIRHYLFDQSIDVSVLNLIDIDKNYILTESNSYQFISPLLSTDFELISINFDSIYFSYDKLISKKVPVILNSNVTYLAGYDSFNEFELSNDSVLVIGSQSKLNKIKFIDTQNLLLENISNDYNDSIKLNINNDKLSYSFNSIKVSIDVDKSTESIIRVPVKVINIPQRTKINYYPKYVDLSFTVSLQNYQSVNDKDFIVLCDFDDIKDDGLMTPFISNKPDFVKNLRINSSNIQYVIEK